jgi:GDP-D-mannose 3',5'-epimerase
MSIKRALVLGAGGFIGHHLVNRLISEGYYVMAADLKYSEFSETKANSFVIADLRNPDDLDKLFFSEGYWDEVYQLAADMGGAEYIFSGQHDADVMHNSALINLNVLERMVRYKPGKVFYSSSACMYPAFNQMDPSNPKCSEELAYPAQPDSEYGWEKLFSERLYLAFSRNHGLNVRIARFHNIFGPLGTYQGGKEKVPAAICRKVAAAKDGGQIEVWGDGKQTRSFLFIDECLEGVRRLMQSSFTGPVNIGSEEMVSINELAKMVIAISGKELTLKNVSSELLGVRGRNSDNNLIFKKLDWKPAYPLFEGLKKTYAWISEQVKDN